MSLPEDDPRHESHYVDTRTPVSLRAKIIIIAAFGAIFIGTLLYVFFPGVFAGILAEEQATQASIEDQVIEANNYGVDYMTAKGTTGSYIIMNFTYTESVFAEVERVAQKLALPDYQINMTDNKVMLKWFLVDELGTIRGDGF